MYVVRNLWYYAQCYTLSIEQETLEKDARSAESLFVLLNKMQHSYYVESKFIFKEK